MSEEYIRKADAVDLVDKISNLDLKAKGGIRVSLANLQKADVVPVVRCDDCVYYGSRRWCELHSSVFDDNAFCSYGERRGEQDGRSKS